MQCTFPSSLTLQKSGCRVLEHLWLREQPRFPSRSGLPAQVGCVLPSLHSTSAETQMEALCWRAGQTDEVSHDEMSHLSVCATFIRGHSFNFLPFLCRGAHKEWPSASPTKQALGVQASREAALSSIVFTPFHQKKAPITAQCSPNKTPNRSKLSFYS